MREFTLKQAVKLAVDIVNNDVNLNGLRLAGGGGEKGMVWYIDERADDQRPDQFLHKLAQSRANSGQRCHLGEKRGQALRAHS